MRKQRKRLGNFSSHNAYYDAPIVTLNMIDRLYNHLTSTKFALALFGTLSLLSVLGTFPGLEVIYKAMFFRALVSLLGLCTFLCSFRRWKTLRWQVHVIHGGVVLTLVGALLGGLGFVATVNVYEGTSVDNAFRWDLERDEPLGFLMKVAAINTEYYPVPVKIGVLRGQEKVGLHVLKTGETFSFDRYEVKPERFILSQEKLKLSVMENGRLIGSVDTDGGNSTLPQGFPFNFKLVAFKDPIVKRMWVDLDLSRNGQLMLKGTSEVNAPLQWNGISFYNTQISIEKDGRRYAGIQIVNDPGRPVVFSGFIITTLGTILAFAAGRRRKSPA